MNSNIHISQISSITSEDNLLMTQSTIMDQSKAIVMKGLQELDLKELAEIFCTRLIFEIDETDKYKNLLQLANNDYLYVLKCILKDIKCQK